MCLGPTISEAYITEYSTDKIEMHIGAINEGDKVLLVRHTMRAAGPALLRGSMI